MTTRFAGHLLTGIHSARPAAADVPEGTLYSCTTHSRVYQSDGASAWTTWATLGGAVTVGIAASDEGTAIAAGTALVTFRVPYAMTLSDVRASLVGAAATGTFTVDINEGGTSILSTKLTIDATEKTSVTAATPPVISDSAIADDAQITIDVDDDGDGAATGLKVWLIGTLT